MRTVMRTTLPLGVPMDGKVLHYEGDLVGRIEGQIVGPNVFGEDWVIVCASYDAETESNQTTARLRVARREDLDSAVPA